MKRVLASLAILSSGLFGQSPESPILELELLRSIRSPPGVITEAAFSPDGTALAIGGELGHVRLLEFPSLTERFTARHDPSRIQSLSFSSDGRYLVSVGRQLSVCDSESGEVLFLSEDDDQDPTICSTVDWSHSGHLLAYARGSSVFVRDFDRRLETVWGHLDSQVDAVSFTPYDSLVIAQSGFNIWEARAPKAPLRLLVGSPPNTPDWLVDMESVRGVLHYSSISGVVVRGRETFEPPGSVFDFAVGNDGSDFAAGGRTRLKHWKPGRQDPQVVRWWSSAGRESQDLVVPGVVHALALHPSQPILFVSTSRGGGTVFEPGEPQVRVEGLPARLFRWALSSDGSVIATESASWELLSLDTGEAIRLEHAVSVRRGSQGAEMLIAERDRLIARE
ncbi:MAG: hypothetical protein AAF196_01175 [Planctomycetota bacterium]